MDPAARPPASDVAFSPSVKAVQARKGSRGSYARMEAGHGWRTRVDDDLRAFLAESDSAFIATASAAGQPYVQHRGGPAGFIRVLDEHTLAFADFDGNRQFITQGNLEENAKAQLFLMDYATRRRVKIWGHARIVEGTAADALMPAGYAARSTRPWCSRSAPGTPTAPNTSRSSSTPPTCRPRWTNATSASPRWRRR